MAQPGIDGSNEATEDLANKIRCHVVRMTHASGASHVASGLSVADILAVLYGGVLRVTPETQGAVDRDRLILSKGHSVAALYGALAEKRFFPPEWLERFYQDRGQLLGHATFGVPGVEFSTGSLGHGLPVGSGMALGGKRDSLAYRVFVVMSDGECDEGSTWEAALFSAHHKLDNLITIVDYNKMQAMGTTQDVLNLEPLRDKWIAFGWAVSEVAGHDQSALRERLEHLPHSPGKPTCLIAHTTKGKGVSFMENELAWHYRAPNEKEAQLALRELGDSQ